MTTNFFSIFNYDDYHEYYTGPRLSDRQSVAALLDTQTELNLNKLVVAWGIEYSPDYEPDESFVLRVLEVLEILKTNTSIRVLDLCFCRGSYRNCYPLPTCARSMQGLIDMLAHNTAIHTLITWDLGNQFSAVKNAQLMTALVDNTRIRTLTITCHIYSTYPMRVNEADLDIIFNAVADMIAANRSVDDLTLSCTAWYASQDNPVTTRFAKVLAPALCKNDSLQRLTLHHQNASILFTDEPCFLEFSCISYLHLRFNAPPVNHYSDYKDPRADGFKHSVAAAVARAAEKGVLNLDDLDGVVDLRKHLGVLGLDGDGAEFIDNAAVLAALKPAYVFK